jgi:hypothetical protein
MVRVGGRSKSERLELQNSIKLTAFGKTTQEHKSWRNMKMTAEELEMAISEYSKLKSLSRIPWERIAKVVPLYFLFFFIFFSFHSHSSTYFFLSLCCSATRALSFSLFLSISLLPLPLSPLLFISLYFSYPLSPINISLPPLLLTRYYSHTQSGWNMNFLTITENYSERRKMGFPLLEEIKSLSTNNGFN